jgi:hypothetical protein
MRKTRFTFDSERYFDGFTDDTRWNGFLNVEVEPAIHAEVVAYFEATDPAFNPEDWKMEAANGRISYAYGFATYEDD